MLTAAVAACGLAILGAIVIVRRIARGDLVDAIVADARRAPETETPDGR